MQGKQPALAKMGLKLATAMSKMMKPSAETEMVLFVFLLLLVLYAARVIYMAPKTMPPKWKKYEEEKRQRRIREEETKREEEEKQGEGERGWRENG